MTTRRAGFVSVAACAIALPAHAEMNFNRIASFAVPANLPADADPATPETSAEIIAATADGMTLVYSDSPLGAIGFVDISAPDDPAAGGSMSLGGEPTSVAVLGNEAAFVGINTSESYTEPSGCLADIDIPGRTETASCDLGGQPDSVALSPDGAFVTVAIEDERDEDLNDGVIPQLPAGYVVIIPLDDSGAMQCDGLAKADLTGLAEIAPDDPEPEFVDVNANGEIAVTLRENNHIAILNASGAVLSHFSAGTVDVKGIDTADDGKQLYRIPFSEMRPAPLGGELPMVSKEEARDFLPDLATGNGHIVDKIEGFTIDTAGQAYAVTDNDGVDDNSGETHFLSLGALEAM